MSVSKLKSVVCGIACFLGYCSFPAFIFFVQINAKVGWIK